jgi:hypothetical protein
MNISLFWDITWKSSAFRRNMLPPSSWWFIACLTLLSWRCRQSVTPKRWINFNGLHGVTYQKTKLFVDNNIYKTYAFPVWPDLLLKSSRRSDSKACVYLRKWFAARPRISMNEKHFWVIRGTALPTYTQTSTSHSAPCFQRSESADRVLASLAVLQPRRFVAGFPPWRPGVDPKLGHVGFVVDKVALGQAFSECFSFLYQFLFHKFLPLITLSSTQ